MSKLKVFEMAVYENGEKRSALIVASNKAEAQDLMEEFALEKGLEIVEDFRVKEKKMLCVGKAKKGVIPNIHFAIEYGVIPNISHEDWVINHVTFIGDETPLEGLFNQKD